MKSNINPQEQRVVASVKRRFFSALRFFLPLPKAKNENVPMRKTFFVWLSAYTAIAFVASLVASFYYEGYSLRQEAEGTLRENIEEARRQVTEARRDLKNAIAGERKNSIYFAKAVAQILEGKPSLLHEKDGIEQLAKTFGLGEIDVVDENGVCVFGWPSYSVGYNFHSNDVTREFLEILDDPTKEIAQPIREAAQKTGDLYQYSAVARRDAPGFIEVGMNAKNVEDAREHADLERFIGSYQVGETGFLLVYQDGAPLDKTPRLNDRAIDIRRRQAAAELKISEIPLEKSFVFQIDGVSYFAFAKQGKMDANGDDGDCLYVGALSKAEMYKPRHVAIALFIVANFLLFSIIFALTSALVQRLVVGGVYSINRSLEKITNGNLDERVAERSTKEFAELTDGINATVDALKGATSEVKRRIAEELELARKIQSESLPSCFPTFPPCREFEIFAENRPESSVGGDIFDFFFIDDEHFVFYVADVSGHGIPAALFMMKAMALVKNLARSENNLADVITLANRYLTENNASMFVTGFFCSLETSSGRLTYVDAGHNPPVFRPKSGVFSEIEPKINLILGVDPDVRYESATLTLEPGDTIFLYTDGVTEATSNATSELFGTARLLDVLNAQVSTESAQNAVEAVFSSVENFAAGADRSDDVTALYLRFNGLSTKVSAANR